MNTIEHYLFDVKKYIEENITHRKHSSILYKCFCENTISQINFYLLFINFQEEISLTSGISVLAQKKPYQCTHCHTQFYIPKGYVHETHIITSADKIMREFYDGQSGIDREFFLKHLSVLHGLVQYTDHAELHTFVSKYSIDTSKPMILLS